MCFGLVGGWIPIFGGKCNSVSEEVIFDDGTVIASEFAMGG